MVSRAKQRVSAAAPETTSLWRLFLIKLSLSLSLSLSLCHNTAAYCDKAIELFWNKFVSLSHAPTDEHAGEEGSWQRAGIDAPIYTHTHTHTHIEAFVCVYSCAIHVVWGTSEVSQMCHRV